MKGGVIKPTAAGKLKPKAGVRKKANVTTMRDTSGNLIVKDSVAERIIKEYASLMRLIIPGRIRAADGGINLGRVAGAIGLLRNVKVFLKRLVDAELTTDDYLHTGDEGAALVTEKIM